MYQMGSFLVSCDVRMWLLLKKNQIHLNQDKNQMKNFTDSLG